jgi:hypothetical protein
MEASPRIEVNYVVVIINKNSIFKVSTKFLVTAAAAPYIWS